MIATWTVPAVRVTRKSMRVLSMPLGLPPWSSRLALWWVSAAVRTLACWPQQQMQEGALR